MGKGVDKPPMHPSRAAEAGDRSHSLLPPAFLDPADQAMLQIVGMGFTPMEARDALMRTDNGTHHSLPLAVEYLLRRRDPFTASAKEEPSLFPKYGRFSQPSVRRAVQSTSNR
jgi:hypothetical protein